MSSQTQFRSTCILMSLLFLGLVGLVQAQQTEIIRTFAGDGTAGYAGDQGPAKDAELYAPNGVAVDSYRNVFVADQTNNRIRRIDYVTKEITTVAGNGTAGYEGVTPLGACPSFPGPDPGDGGQAIDACLNNPSGVAVDSAGNIFIADTNNYRIRKVSPSGTITTVAGGGICATGVGDGRLATLACLELPSDVAVDSAGNLFIADTGNSRIREVLASNQTIFTIAGGGTNYGGDGGPATSAILSVPLGIALDGQGDLYIADSGENRVRKVNFSSGTISTFAGIGTGGYAWAYFGSKCPNNGGLEPGDGGLATSACLNNPSKVAVSQGVVFIGDSGNERVRVVLQNGIIQTFAGGGTENRYFCGDGQPATQACLNDPMGVAATSPTDVYIADRQNSRVRSVYGTQCTPGAPSIIFNGRNIAGKSTPATVGQEIVLTGFAPTQECTSETATMIWSLPQATTMNAIGGYIHTDGSEPQPVIGPVIPPTGEVIELPPDTSSTSYGPFYFVYPGTYTLTYQYTLNNGTTSPVSTATFSVTGPTGGTLPVVPYPRLTVGFLSGCTKNGKAIPAGLWLMYGKVSGTCSQLTGGTPGIVFNTATGYQNSSGGKFFLVQLISKYVTNGALPSVKSSGLDDTYPYSETLPASDSPHVGPLIATDNSQTIEFVANMFLMWQPNLPNSIPVPLGYQPWEVSGTATCAHSCGTASSWIIPTTSLGDPRGNKFVPSAASQASVGYPTWTGISE